MSYEFHCSQPGTITDPNSGQVIPVCADGYGSWSTATGSIWATEIPYADVSALILAIVGALLFAFAFRIGRRLLGV